MHKFGPFEKKHLCTLNIAKCLVDMGLIGMNTVCITGTYTGQVKKLKKKRAMKGEITDRHKTLISKVVSVKGFYDSYILWKF